MTGEAIMPWDDATIRARRAWWEVLLLAGLYLGEGIVFLFSLAGLLLGVWFVAIAAGLA